jgi:hypothetical protein
MDPALVANLRADAAASGTTTATIKGAPMRFKTVEQGAATSVLVATSPQLKGIGGRYFEDCRQAEVLPPDAVGTAPSGVAPYALDPDSAERLGAIAQRRGPVRAAGKAGSGAGSVRDGQMDTAGGLRRARRRP